MPAASLVFSRLGVQYGVPVSLVMEIAGLQDVAPLPEPIPGCVGGMSYRGYLLPVLDPACLGTDRQAELPERAVILRDGDAVFGLLLDGFVGVDTLDGVGEVAEDGPSHAGRVIAYGGGALVLLSVDALLRLVRERFARQRFPDAADAAADAAQEDAGKTFLCARIEDISFAVPVEHVTEIVEGNDLTPLFGVPSLLRGLINLRGQVVACLDISGELDLGPRPLGERTQFVVLTHEDAELALCVDRVTGIRRLAPTALQRSEAVLGGSAGRVTGFVHEDGDGTLLVMAVPAVFDAPALAPLRAADP